MQLNEPPFVPHTIRELPTFFVLQSARLSHRLVRFEIERILSELIGVKKLDTRLRGYDRGCGYDRIMV